MNLDNILRNNAFENIEPDRLDAIRSIVEEVRGKNSYEALLVISKYGKALSKGREITPAEKDAMISVIYSSLSPSEQESFKGVLKLIDRFGK